MLCFIQINFNKINLNKNKPNLQKGDFYVYWQRKRVSILKRILWKRQNWRMRMFCCLNWIHFMDETEDSIDIKVNYKRKDDYSPLISSFNFIQINILVSIYIFYKEIIYVFLTIFLYLLKCPQSLILSALRAFCFCGKPHISRSIFLYFRYQSWLKSW